MVLQELAGEPTYVPFEGRRGGEVAKSTKLALTLPASSTAARVASSSSVNRRVVLRARLPSKAPRLVEAQRWLAV
jgi:hypothetical protein